MTVCKSLARLVLGTLAASVLSVVALPTEPASALPSKCDGTLAANVYRWVGGQADHDWMNPNNWVHGPSLLHEAPNDNKSLADPWQPGVGGDTSDTVACVSANDYVEFDNSTTAYVWVQELYVEGSFTIRLNPVNTGLLVMGSAAESSLGPGVRVDLQGTFGGTAVIHNFGSIVALSTPDFPALLTSVKNEGESSYTGTAGQLIVEPGGSLDFAQRGVGIAYRYRVLLRGSSTVSNDAYLAANYGTRLEIAPGGALTFTGDGGYYQGFSAGQTQPSDLVNGGRLVKSPPGHGTTVIDATYSQVGGGEVVVQSGEIALPDTTVRAAQVSPGATFSTGKCGSRGPLDPCGLATSAAQDPQSISMTIPAGNRTAAKVTLREGQPAGAVVFDSEATAEGLKHDPLDPAVLDLRFEQNRAPVPNLDYLSVANGPDGPGLPTCLGSGAPPLDAVACVDRRGLPTSTRVEAGNVHLVVRTTTTTNRSRWIGRKETADRAAPTLSGAAVQKTKLDSKIPVKVSSSEAGKLKASGTIAFKVGGKKYSFKVKAAAAAVDGKKASLILQYLPADRKKAQRLAAAAPKGKAKLTVTAKDKAGNAVSMRVDLTLT